jgi:hypothetical protein
MRPHKREPVIESLYRIMSKGGWWSLPELQVALLAEGRLAIATSISARLRDLRKPPWSRTLARRTREGTSNLEEYSISFVN